MSISLDCASNSVKEFSISLSTSPEASHHKYFKTASGHLKSAIGIALVNPWSPIVWQNNERKKAEFKSCSIVALDIDDGFPLEDAKTWLQKLKLRSAIMLSKSHQKDKKTSTGHISKACDRFRIIIDADTVKELDQYEMNMRHWLSKLPMADKSCKDGGRFFFASPHLVYSQDGDIYHWNDFAKEIAAEKKIVEEMTKKRVASFQSTGAISEGLKDFIKQGVSAGGRHKACYWLGCVLAEMGIGLEESVRLVCSGPLAEIGEQEVRRQIIWGRKKVLGGKGK